MAQLEFKSGRQIKPFFQGNLLLNRDRSIKKDCPCFKEMSSGPSVNVNMELKASQEVSDNYNSSQKMVIDGKVQSI